MTRSLSIRQAAALGLVVVLCLATGVWGLFRVGDPGTPSANAMCSQPTSSPAAKPKPNPLIQRFRRPPLNPGGSGSGSNP